jgi:hypothetical protein
MLHKIKSILKESYLTFKNRRRFDSIHSDARFNFLDTIFIRLRNNDPTLTDKLILEKYHKFSSQIHTNTFASAELEWVTVSVLCYYRPHLTKELIKEGLLCIVSSIRDEIDYNDVLNFIQIRILKNVEPYGGWPPKEGIEWLTNKLPNESKLVQSTLEEIIEQNKKEMEDN